MVGVTYGVRTSRVLSRKLSGRPGRLRGQSRTGAGRVSDEEGSSRGAVLRMFTAGTCP